jgi:peptidoglycan/xylan/chitin deacetylase (PgdA/CDA1 family)
MALRAAEVATTSFVPTSQPAQRRNDAFSFWKLPENWRCGLEPAIEDSEAIANRYLLENYLDSRHRRPPAVMHAYYPLKGMIPHRLRHAMNSFLIRARPRPAFPNWPCEPVLVDFWRKWLREYLAAIGETDPWHIGFWPEAKKCCIVLTHDVDSALGFERMERMAEIEELHGFRSAWNLPLAQYPIDWRVVERLRSRGFEFGAHGLRHDGRLFRSRKDFEALVPVIERLALAHDLPGFRAPSTLRRIDWISEMAFEFDSSCSDTDPFEPQPGGTCSLFPFFISDMIELPYTLAQDHTLVHVLRRDPLAVWTEKMRWICSLGGMILVLTHPDYCGMPPNLSKYEQLLTRLRAIQDSWCALPSEVARWWRQRSALNLFIDNGAPVIQGSAAGAVAVRLSSEPLALRGGI